MANDKLPLHPLRFTPYYKEVLWGGDRIANLKQQPSVADRIGESWEVSAIAGHESVVTGGTNLDGLTLTQLVEIFGSDLLGEDVVKRFGKKFPLLVKLIDARDDLSIQVHPDDTKAGEKGLPSGKTEMWYIIDHDPGAKIVYGFSKPCNSEGLRNCISNGKIFEVLNVSESRRDEVLFVPAGTIHAIGAGNLLAEIQQPSDVTYRLYDYNRRDANGNLRELHVDDAIDAVDYSECIGDEPTGKVVDSTRKMVVDCDFFKIDTINLSEGEKYGVDNGGRTFSILLVTQGELIVESDGTETRCPQGNTLLMPAVMHRFTIKGHGKGLLAYC